MNQRVQGSGPLLYADAAICLTRSKISTKVVCVHLSARPSARVQCETNILKWGQTLKQVVSISGPNLPAPGLFPVFHQEDVTSVSA